MLSSFFGKFLQFASCRRDRACRWYAQVIHIFVKDEIVHRCELVQVSLRWSFELDVRSQLNFVCAPSLDSYRTSRRGDQSDRTAVMKRRVSRRVEVRVNSWRSGTAVF